MEGPPREDNGAGGGPRRGDGGRRGRAGGRGEVSGRVRGGSRHAQGDAEATGTVSGRKCEQGRDRLFYKSRRNSWALYFEQLSKQL